MENDYKYIDLGYLDLMSDGDAGMKSILLELLLNEPVENIQLMNEYLNARNWKDFQFVAHKLKSSFPYTGYKKLIEENVELDRVLKAKLDGSATADFESKVSAMLANVNQYYEEVLPELQDAYNGVANAV